MPGKIIYHSLDLKVGQSRFKADPSGPSAGKYYRFPTEGRFEFLDEKQVAKLVADGAVVRPSKPRRVYEKIRSALRR